ncbi:hypothetical protein RJP21_05015 [Paenibacillus sp. VCA1]|uniref:hypothetical protein n=1 Tax=Paenibacillus sp. VCA1 TaxID=3039148 RepID=UPI0028729DAC|nr:hypothetical protein [Paenibacillus sp. VCA1]MDR9852960.1 hypothetical protein [Paenibacillus sp. VCA1]
MTMLNASITQNYRITSDGAQFILQRRHIVDPTKAPGYKAEEGAPVPKTSEEWRNFKFYPLNETGLAAAVKSAVLRDTDVSQAQTIAEALRIYADATDRLTEVITECLRVPRLPVA